MRELSEHLSENSVAAFVDGRLSSDERRRTEAHLADCGECREEVVAVSGIVAERPRARMALLPASMAAALVLVIAYGVSNRSAQPEQPVFRAEITQRALAAEMTSASTFAWRAVVNVLEYRLTIMSPVGDVVAERVTSDTTTSTPTLPAGAYKWYVTATLDNGSVLTSTVQSFVAR